MSNVFEPNTAKLRGISSLAHALTGFENAATTNEILPTFSKVRTQIISIKKASPFHRCWRRGIINFTDAWREKTIFGYRTRRFLGPCLKALVIQGYS